MVICLKIPYYFYTNLNFQRPISHLILIWDPLNLHHFRTLQIKLSNFGRTAMWMNCWEFYPQSWSVWQSCCVAQLPADLPPQNPIPFFYLLYPINKKMAYKAYFCEICRHSPNNFLLFLYKFYFQRPISHLILIWDPLKSIILALCRSNWATLTDLVPPSRWVFTLSIH